MTALMLAAVAAVAPALHDVSGPGQACATRYAQLQHAHYAYAVYRRPAVSRRARRRMARMRRCARSPAAKTNMVRVELRAGAARKRRAVITRLTPYTGPGGTRWAIPWPIVQCESRGQNTPPNRAGASGYYQFIASTWHALGGPTGHAYQASRETQDRVASRLWARGAGAGQWDCAGLVGWQ